MEDSRPAPRRRAIEPIGLYKVDGEEILTVEGYFWDGTKIYKPKAPKRKRPSPG